MHDALTAQVAAYIARHRMIDETTRVLGLVSGGADSMCLLHLLADRAPDRVGVLTMDHGLRPEAAREVDAVADAARGLGLPVWIEQLEVGGGPALQERARDARHAAAHRLAAAHGFDRIATGHTASDQAETVLFRIARGTGRSGAVGMSPVSGNYIRPLLCLTAGETRAWCQARGLAVVDDPSNADMRFARTRVRHGLLPELNAVHAGAERAVARFADQLRDEAEVLDDAVDVAWQRCARGDGLQVAALAGHHPALARLLIRRLMIEAGVAAESGWIDRCIALTVSGGRPIQLPGGVAAVDRGLFVIEPSPAPPPMPMRLDVPGQVVFGCRIVRARHGLAEGLSGTRVAVRVDQPLLVRSVRPGDRVALAGGGRQAVGKLLGAAGVPARHRPNVPVVVAGDQVVWVGGYRVEPTLIAEPSSPATLLEVVDA
jgi:tRNA(Ile)-lysidine synthase